MHHDDASFSTGEGQVPVVAWRASHGGNAGDRLHVAAGPALPTTWEVAGSLASVAVRTLLDLFWL